MDDNGNRLYPNAKIAISAVDYDYWTDLSRILEAPHMKDFFSGAHYNLLPYRDRLIFVEDGKQVVPGITAHAATGHSPGHYIYAIESRDETLIGIGDLSHHEILLLKRPRWEFAFDHDPAKAAKTRIRVLTRSRRRGTPFLLAISHSQGSGICARMPTVTPGSPVKNSLLTKQV